MSQEQKEQEHSFSQNKAYHNSGNVEVLKFVGTDGKTVLDIGCGTGSVARELKGKGKTVDGITLSEIELEQASKYMRNGYIHNLEEGLPTEIPNEEYDYIICSHVIEHIAYPEKLLADISRTLKKDGILVVALPNVFFYRYRMQLMKGSFKSTEGGIWDYTHLRWYSFDTAQHMLKNNGFNIQVADVSGELPFSSVLKYCLPSSLRKSLYKMLTSISKGLFGYQLLYTAKKQ